jgi:hypothetical protein
MMNLGHADVVGQSKDSTCVEHVQRLEAIEPTLCRIADHRHLRSWLVLRAGCSMKTR